VALALVHVAVMAVPAMLPAPVVVAVAAMEGGTLVLALALGRAAVGLGAGGQRDRRYQQGCRYEDEYHPLREFAAKHVGSPVVRPPGWVA
jgi:hypothetical protein